MKLIKLALVCLAAIAFSSALAQVPGPLTQVILDNPVRSFHEGATGAGDFALAVDRNFPVIVEQNVAGMSADSARAWLDCMSDVELQHLAQLYASSNIRHGRAAKLLHVMAARLDPQGLARVALFFGRDDTAAAVAATAPHQLNDFLNQLAEAKPPALAETLRPVVFNADGFTPAPSMTFTQLYQGFRSMRVGSRSAIGSVYEVLMYGGKHVMAAYGSSYAVGVPLSKVMENYVPDIYWNQFVPSAGGTVSKAQSKIQLGAQDIYKYRRDWLNLAGVQELFLSKYYQPPFIVEEFTRSGGDYGMVIEYSTYIGGGGHGGCDCDDRDPV